jgi:hypothetical protein
MPTPISNETIGLKYDPSEIDIYPKLQVFKSDTPSVAIHDQYLFFGIDTALHTVPDGFQYSKLKIDKNCGVITYDNTGGALLPGKLSIDVYVSGVLGVAVVKDAYVINIKDVPIEVTANPAEIDVNALYVGDISQLSYTTTGDITSVTYKLFGPHTGFGISPEGVVKKTTMLPSGTYKLSIMVTTNLGAKVFQDLITVNVGEAPTIKYMKHDGSGKLTKVTLTPYSPYSTLPPVVEGMTPDSWTLKLPATAPAELVDAMTIADDGVISVAGGKGIPAGDYVIGVIATESEIPVPFDSVFTLSVAESWTSIEYINETHLDPANGYATYGKDPASNAQFGYDAGQKLVKGYHGNDQIFNSWIILKVDYPSDVNGGDLLISFKERNGWGPAQEICYQEFVRTLSYSYDGNTWTPLMDANDEDWPTEGAGNSFHDIQNQDMGSYDLNNTTIYFKWHYDNSASATHTKSVWMLDNFKFDFSTGNSAVEE